ncbi:Pollen Ole e 1 allergen and extensin family protein [Euphorbia peplus]|nr:Pollen Ole e 1 allergen and extensin family protein [Euphorbia peplus]
MARLILLFALFALPAIALAGRPARNPFEVEGRVFCDTCQAGFETPKTTYIAGARVRVECKNRQTMKLVFTKEATTDSTGTYKMYINEDHEDQLCDATLISSPQSSCKNPVSGRDRARVILTNYNGIASNRRYANAMGFEAEEAMSGCTELLKQYQEYED